MPITQNMGIMVFKDFVKWYNDYIEHDATPHYHTPSSHTSINSCFDLIIPTKDCYKYDFAEWLVKYTYKLPEDTNLAVLPIQLHEMNGAVIGLNYRQMLIIYRNPPAKVIDFYHFWAGNHQQHYSDTDSYLLFTENWNSDNDFDPYCTVENRFTVDTFESLQDETVIVNRLDFDSVWEYNGQLFSGIIYDSSRKEKSVNTVFDLTLIRRPHSKDVDLLDKNIERIELDNPGWYIN